METVETSTKPPQKSFFQLHGDLKLINSQGLNAQLGEYEDKYVGFYFGAAWFHPCLKFTPILAETYKCLKKTHPDFEIIFISLDKSEESFVQHTKNMPWFLLPYSQRHIPLVNESLIPSLPTLLFFEKGKLVSKNGVLSVLEDSQGKLFPWRDPSFSETISRLINPKWQQVKFEEIKNTKYLGIFFSAQWCPNCQVFDPKLIETYKKLKKNGQSFEIIFVSNDKENQALKKYFEEMPWLAIPFDQDTKINRELLANMLGIGGMIPSLIMIDLSKTSDGHVEVITKHGVESVMEDPEGEKFPWYPQPFKYLDSSALQRLERSPCFIVISQHKDNEKLMEKVSKEYRGTHPGDVLSFLFGTLDYPLALDLINTTKSKKEAMMVIVFAQRLKFVSSDEISESAMKKILQDFDNKKLAFTQLVV